MPPRLSMLFLLLCLTSYHVLAVSTDEPLLTISKTETCPEKCLCVENQDNPDILDVVCSPTSDPNDNPPPADVSVENIIDFVEPVITAKEETTEDLNDDVVQNASVEEGADITNMEVKAPENSTMQADAPSIVTALDNTEVKNVEVKTEDGDNEKQEGNSDELSEERPEVPELVKNVEVKAEEGDNEEQEGDELNEEEPEVPELVKNVEVKTEEGDNEEQEGESDELSEEEPEVPEVEIAVPTSSPIETNFDNEVMQGDEPAKDEEEQVTEEEEKPTEAPEVKNEEVPEVLVGDPDAKVIAKKAPQTSDEEEAVETKLNPEDIEGASDEQDTDDVDQEDEAKPEPEEVPEPQIIPEEELAGDAIESDDTEDNPVVAATEAPAPEVQPEESEQKPPEVDTNQMDYDSDEASEEEEDKKEEPIIVKTTEAPEVTVAAIIQNIQIQRIEEVDSEKLLDTELDSILLPDGEFINIGDQMDDAMSGKMISNDSEGTTQPQQSTASWVILGLILATFVGVVGYATVRGRMDKKKEDLIARVVPPSAPTAVDSKANRRPPNEGTEMKVLSRPLLHPGDEENNLKEFKDNKDDLKQVVIADVPDIPYIDDSDNDKPNKVAKPPRKHAPPPPISIPADNVIEGPWSPTTQTLVRTRIVDSPQIARVMRTNNKNYNPFDE